MCILILPGEEVTGCTYTHTGAQGIHKYVSYFPRAVVKGSYELPCGAGNQMRDLQEQGLTTEDLLSPRAMCYILRICQPFPGRAVNYQYYLRLLHLDFPTAC